MTRLTILAHAATAATRTAAFPTGAEPLESAGLASAAALAGALRRVDAAWVAPTRAAAETATALGLHATTVDPALRDWNAGTWTGRTLDDVAATDPAGLAAWLTGPDADPHAGETLRALLARTAAWLGSLDPSPTRIVAVASPSLLRAALVAALDAPPAAFWRIDVAPLARLRLARTAGRWTLRSLDRLR